MSDLVELETRIIAKGEEVRSLKSSKAAKDRIDVAVKELLELKESYKTANGGNPYNPPKPQETISASPKKDITIQVVEREGPSKKELNKLARKEKKQAYKSGETEGSEGLDTQPPAIASQNPLPQVTSTESQSKPAVNVKTTGLKIIYTRAHPSELASAVVGALGLSDVHFVESADTNASHLPYISAPASHRGMGSISGDSNISRFLCRSAPPASPNLYSLPDPWASSEVDQWLDLYTAYEGCDRSEVERGLLPLVEAHLSDKTLLVGHSLTLADLAVAVLLRRVGSPSSSSHPNTSRFLALVSSPASASPSSVPGQSGAAAASKGKGKTKPPPSGSSLEAPAVLSSSSSSSSSSSAQQNEDEGGSCPPLEGAVEGAVCTRFPPEPSGYLHIGHAKAVLLNQFYAQKYKGRLLIRFDDTNPSKEKEEYEENILQDLVTLGVKWDQVSHTSDHFEKCENLARQLISEGKAYMDDTDQETMQAERLKLVESARRSSSVESNLALFESLLLGEAEARKYCLRAKIDMSSVNGTMRDPVLYRFNDTPHHRTATKHKAYPTYDFACPIVDSLEGVTHALRTTEYNDRDEQYRWLQEALGLRPVHIQAFGKMNFVHTVLSKRKLNWFVEQGLVEGWFDPRFPTIQGCVRRGVNVEALKSFILSQGASRRVITMEWDKFWAENKRVLEDTSERYMAVTAADAVLFTVTNLDDTVDLVMVPVHPQKPELGMRVMRRLNKLWVDQVDAATFTEGEEVTFIRWGNFFIDKITRESGIVVSMEPEVVPCRLVEFDHLISKAKLGDDEDFKDFVNPITKKEVEGWADPCIRLLKQGSVIQLERKGFFRVDKLSSSTEPAVLFAIPDGRQKAPATPAPAAASTGKSKTTKK